MSFCSYLYTSGLRIASGQAVVELDDSKTYRVVRNGKGASRLNRKSANPPSDGEITLRDLEARLKAQGRSSIAVRVHTPDGSFSALLDPANAMGRSGRQADFTQALANLSQTEQVIAAKHQIRTLPYSTNSDETGRAAARLRAALEIVPIEDVLETDPGAGFWNCADPDTIQKAVDVLLTKELISPIPQTIDVVFDRFLDTFSNEQLKKAAYRYPEKVMEHVSTLDPAQRETAIKSIPHYPRAELLKKLIWKKEISPAELDEFQLLTVLQNTDTDLFGTILTQDALPAESVKMVVENYPDKALDHLLPSLTPPHLEIACQAAVHYGYHIDVSKVTAEQIPVLSEYMPHLVAQIAPERLTEAQLDVLTLKHSPYAITYAWQHLNKRQRRFLIKNKPSLLLYLSPPLDKDDLALAVKWEKKLKQPYPPLVEW